jgi:hypothetical protein
MEQKKQSMSDGLLGEQMSAVVVILRANLDLNNAHKLTNLTPAMVFHPWLVAVIKNEL